MTGEKVGGQGGPVIGFSKGMARALALMTLVIVCLAMAPANPAAGASTTQSSLLTPSNTLPTYGNETPRFGIVDAYEDPQAASDLGVTWERVNVYWNAVEPDKPGEAFPLPSISDAQLAAEINRGVTVVGLIGNPPGWATRNGSTPVGLDLPYDNPNNQWARFVGYIVKRYAGRIDRWIFWNEPDIPPDMVGSTWAGTDNEFYNLMKTGYLAAKAANPNATVIFPGTTYWVDIQRNNHLFFQRILDLAAQDPTAPANNWYMDAVDLHVYSRPSDLYKIPLAYRDVMRQHGIDKPITISEMNVVPYDDPTVKVDHAFYRATLDQQAAFMMQACVYAMAAGVRWISVYKLKESSISAEGPYGLIRADGSQRPAYSAYKTAIGVLKNVPSLALQQTQSGLVATFSRTDGSGQDDVAIGWATGQAPSDMQIKVTGNAAFTMTKLGATQPLTVSLSAQPYDETMPGSTAPSDDGAPVNARIGGDPIILVQTGVGQGIRVSPTELDFPQTGYKVADPFIQYFDAHGGLDALGQPSEDQHTEQGSLVQRFDKVSLRYHPEFKGSKYAIESVPAGSPFADPGAYLPFAPVPPSANSPTNRFFPQTGHSVSYAFLTYFDQHGGVDMFGYPRTEELTQDGRIVQWFQRAVFEYHGDSPDPAAQVQERPLGVYLTANRQFPAEAPSPDSPTKHFFANTGHEVANGFLAYFNAHGGVASFGYPISGEIPETDSSGAIHTVQYFQYARFEYHPELVGTPYEVQLGLLGDEYLGLRR